MACEVFECRLRQAFDLVQEAVVETFADVVEGCLHISEIAQEAGLWVWRAAERDFRIEGMAVQAPVFRGAVAQVMRGVEAEFLRQFDHGRGVWQAGWPGVKGGIGFSGAYINAGAVTKG